MKPLLNWERGIERAIQRVIAGMAAFYTISAALWIPTAVAEADRMATILLVVGVVVLAATCVRAWMTLLSRACLVATNLAMVAALWVNAELGVDSGGIGVQAGPAYVFMALSLLIAALTLMWPDFWKWALLTTTLYVLGRWIGGTRDDLWAGLDEVVSDTSTIAAAGLILTFYRRAGRRADEALEVRLDVSRREAQSAAAERAATEERRLLHDEIIAALVSIEHSGPTGDSRRAAEVARRARRTLFLETPQARAADMPGWLFDSSDVSLPVTLEIDPTLSMTDALPAHVTIAMTGAVNEALRNVERHAQARSVRVMIEPFGRRGARVTITDDGRGLDATHSAGFGIKQSIIGRLEGVGGTAFIHSADGGGTKVELTWSGEEEVPPPHPAESVSVIGSPRRFAYSVTAVALVGQLWLVARHLSGPGEAAVALGSLALILAVARTAAYHRIGVRAVTAMFAADAAILLWGLSAAGPGALLDFRSWIVEMTCVIIFSLTFFVSLRAMLTLALMLSTVILAWTVHDPTVTLGEVGDPLLQPIFYAAALGATAWGFRKVSATIAEEERRAAHQLELEATHHAIVSRDNQQFNHLRARLDPYFTAIETGTIDVASPEVIDRARALALQVRDEMYLPGLLDDDLRLLLATARESGTSITIRETASDNAGESVRLLLKAAIDPATVAAATLSLPTPAAPYIRLVIVPAVMDPRGDHLVRDLAPLGAEIESLEHATVITMAVNPEDAPRHVPS